MTITVVTITTVHTKKEVQNMNTCPYCGRSLRGGELTLPWEDGDNASAYVRCPHCGVEVYLDGFGEDDD